MEKKEGGSGEDCDDEDGCETSGQESGKSHVHTNTTSPAGRNEEANMHINTHMPACFSSCYRVSGSHTTNILIPHTQLMNV